MIISFPESNGSSTREVGLSKSNTLVNTNESTGSAYTRLTYDDPVGTGGGGKGPLIEREIGSVDYSTLKYQARARLDDVVRVSKMLVTSNGLRWEGHMAALNTVQTISDSKRLKQYGESRGFLTAVGNVLASGVITTATTLAQVAVTGTGVRLMPFFNRAYIHPTTGGTFGAFVAKLGGGGVTFIGSDTDSAGWGGKGLARPSYGNSSIKDLHDTRTSPAEKKHISNTVSLGADTVSEILKTGDNVDYLKTVREAGYEDLRLEEAVKDSANTSGEVQSRNSSGYTTNSTGNVRAGGTYQDLFPVNSYTSDLTYENGVENVTEWSGHLLKNKYETSENAALDSISARTLKKAYAPGGGLPENVNPTNNYSSESRYAADVVVSREKRESSTGVLGKRTISSDGDPVLYNGTGYGKDLSNTKTITNIGSNPTEKELQISGLIPFYISSISPNKRVNCIFEANLDSYKDNYTGNWEEVQYVGRADNFYVYSGFNREIQFSFKAVAKQQDNLRYIYDNLNQLAGVTAPTYDEAGAFMRGTLSCVRIGDILVNQVGIITGVGFSWDTNVPWELEDIVVPHMLTVDVSFKPIHDFVPTADSIYFGNINK